MKGYEWGCQLLYLPPYSWPEFNPIEEEAFSKTKGLMRKAEARIREALIEAMGAAILGAQCPGYPRLVVEHCGYGTSVQPF